MSKSESKTQMLGIVLGFAGVLLTVLATVFAPVIQERLKPTVPSQTPIVIVASPTQEAVHPTDTAVSVEPTSTSAVSDTPLPPPTATFTAAPVLAPGVDWTQGCIGTLWSAFPASTPASSTGGCYAEPLLGVFSARNQRLELSVDKSVASAEVNGIFVEVPSDSLVNLVVHLDQIEGGELWVGIFGQPDINSPGLLAVVPEGNVKNSAFAAYQMPSKNRFYLSDKFSKSSANYEVAFDVSPSNVLAKFEKYSSTSTVPISSEKKYLFIGYQAVFGKQNRIVASFFDLLISPR